MKFFKQLNFWQYLVIIIGLLTCVLGISDLLPFWELEADFYSKSIAVESFNLYLSINEYLLDGVLSFVELRYLYLLPLIGLIIVAYRYISTVFTSDRALVFLMVLLSQPVFLGFSKIISADILIALLQTVSFFGGILYSKSNKRETALLVAIALIILSFINFEIFLITILGVFILVYKNKALHVYLFSILVIGHLFYMYYADESLTVSFPNYLFKNNLGICLIALLLACFPWLPFLVAGLVDSIKKVNKGDEFSKLILIGFFMGLGTLSPFFNIICSLLVSKHLVDYSLEKYPHKNIIKTVLVISTVAIFMGSIALSFITFTNLGGVGFRMMATISLSIWIPLIFAMIMIYGDRFHYIIKTLSIGGSIISFLIIIFLGSVYYDYYLGAQDRLLEFCKDENIPALTLETANKNKNLDHLFLSRIKNAGIKIKDKMKYSISYDLKVKKDSLKNKVYDFDNLPTFYSNDSLLSIKPILYQKMQ